MKRKQQQKKKKKKKKEKKESMRACAYMTCVHVRGATVLNLLLLLSFPSR